MGSIYFFSGNYGKIVVAHLVAVTSIGIISAAAIHFKKRKSKSLSKDHHSSDVLALYLDRTESSRVGKLERFSDYVGKF